MRRATPLSKGLDENKTSMILMKMHEGVYGIHIGGMVLANKIIKIVYYWPSMLKYSVEYLNKCNKCQQFSNLHHTPAEVLHSVTMPHSFY